MNRAMLNRGGPALVFASALAFATGGWAQDDLVDSDGDTVPDVVENYFDLNPNLVDSDADGVDDAAELAEPCYCDPLLVDSDDDGVCDGPVAFASCRARREGEGICAPPGRLDEEGLRLTGSGGCAAAEPASALGAFGLALVAAGVWRRRRLAVAPRY